MYFWVASLTRLGGPGLVLCEKQGDLIAQKTVLTDLDNPSYAILSKSGETLFVVGECKGTDRSAVASYRLQGDILKLCSVQETHGKAACHLTLHASEQYLYVVNYLGGTVVAFPVEGSVIAPCMQKIKHHGSGQEKIRQKTAHPHQVLFAPQTNELFVCDLGMDTIMIYELEVQTGMLEAIGRIEVMPGSGPRHLVFNGANRFYLVCELSNQVYHFERNLGVWKCRQVLSTVPSGWQGTSFAAAIRLMDNRLYVSNRGHDSLAIFRIEKDASLISDGWIKIAGAWPRDFQVLGEDLFLFACQKDGVILARGERVLASIPIVGAICVAI